MTGPGRGEVLWTPPAERTRRSRLSAFEAYLATRHGTSFGSYPELWAWSVGHLDELWSAVWDFFGVTGERGEQVLSGRLPGARWFPGAMVNFAENVLAGAGAGVAPPAGSGAPSGAPAVIALSQTRPAVGLTRAELADLVARVRVGLTRLGVGRDDRVGGYLPNGAEALAAFLATASLGALWSSCAPEFGARAVLDRFGQIRPKVVLAADGYRYGNKVVDRTEELGVLARELPGLGRLVVVPHLGVRAIEGAMGWDELTGEHAPLDFVRVPFDHPLFVLYSSGTTGPPKAIVHGHGGILLEHLKALGLHADLGPGDRFFWFSTTGWMMWNFLVSGLLVGATVVCYDGDPAFPDLGALWAMAAEEKLTYFGTSAPFITACMRAGLRPGSEHDLSGLRTVGSTGAPLSADGARWVYAAVGPDLALSSISGGTDVCTAFVGGTPGVAVRAGEIPARYLGVGAEAFGADGVALTGTQGELVVTAPMPSMPVGLWGDEDGSRYRETYFSDFPGVWRHGDWVTFFEDGACVISGRSDATLNRAGVRLGTGELYSLVESMEGISDSLVVHLEDDAGGPGRLLLFVVPAAVGPDAVGPDAVGTGGAAELDPALAERIRAELRRSLSPRHVPDVVMAVTEVPRTLSGKKLEVPVKRLLMGEPAERVVTPGALANPAALDAFVHLAAALAGERRTAAGPSAPGSGEDRR